MGGDGSAPIGDCKSGETWTIVPKLGWRMRELCDVDRPERILAHFRVALVFGPFGEYACALSGWKRSVSSHLPTA